MLTPAPSSWTGRRQAMARGVYAGLRHRRRRAVDADHYIVQSPAFVLQSFPLEKAAGKLQNEAVLRMREDGGDVISAVAVERVAKRVNRGRASLRGDSRQRVILKAHVIGIGHELVAEGCVDGGGSANHGEP